MTTWCDHQQNICSHSPNLLAGLNVVVDLPVLHGGAHHGGLPDAALHLPLGGQVDDHREVDDGHGAQHGQGLAQTEGAAYCPETGSFSADNGELISPVPLDSGLLLCLVFVLSAAAAHPVL